jgi:5-methylcytosine-specific restriction endonuclease McrA
MGKKLPTTPRSRVRAALRSVWLRSRERQAAIKRENNCCEECGRKGSKAKGKEVAIEVHHLAEEGINWERIMDYIYRHLLCDPKHLEVLCKDCHDHRHKEAP